MPFVRIALASEKPSPAQVAALQQRATALMADVLGKRAELTVVAVEHQPAAHWSVGGAALAGEGRPLASLDALITAGTNSAAQKAAFIQATHAMLADVLGPLGSPVYVALREVAAGDWGYDGMTQAARRDAPPSQAPRTLRDWAGLPRRQALPVREAALVLVDYQREYLDGPLRVAGVDAAVAHAVALREWAAAAGLPVIHVHHVAARPDAALFAPDSAGAAPIAGLEPRADEHVVVKQMPSSLHGTGLQELLHRLGAQTLILAGFATHMCVDATARDAVHRGFQVVVVPDACGSRDLQDISGGDLHRASLAAMADRFVDLLEMPVA